MKDGRPPPPTPLSLGWGGGRPPLLTYLHKWHRNRVAYFSYSSYSKYSTKFLKLVSVKPLGQPALALTNSYVFLLSVEKNCPILPKTNFRPKNVPKSRKFGKKPVHWKKIPKNSNGFDLPVLYGLCTVTFEEPKIYAHCKEMAKTKLFDIPVTVEDKRDKTNYFKNDKVEKKFLDWSGKEKKNFLSPSLKG